MTARKGKICISLGKFDPFRQLSWLAKGGEYCEIHLTSALFLPSANGLAWRNAPRRPRSRVLALNFQFFREPIPLPGVRPKGGAGGSLFLEKALKVSPKSAYGCV